MHSPILAAAAEIRQNRLSCVQLLERCLARIDALEPRARACGMCLAALGSQTGGSITRPASYCGVAGCKPTFGTASADGVLPLAPSMDHVGSMARSVRDVALLLQAIADPPVSDWSALAA